MRIEELPTLFGVSRVGKIKQWKASVVENEDHTATILVESGFMGQKIRKMPSLVKKGKNIGKSNKTTPFEQALSQAISKWKGKRDQNYELNLSILDPKVDSKGVAQAGINYTPRLMLPQLARDVGKGKIVYPALMQPKLNGVCDLGEVINYENETYAVHHHSRGGQLFTTLNHLDWWIRAMSPPAPLHGELYVHGWSLQKIGSYVKKIKPDQEKLQYWIYDIAWLEVPYEKRIDWIQRSLQKLHSSPTECPLIFTPTVEVNSYEEAKKWHDKWVQDGFEGGMLKNKNGIYIFQFKSDDLEKVKDYKDDEFEIIGGKEGTGTDEGCIIYKCRTVAGDEFDVRPRGTVEDRKEMLKNLPNDIGKMLTVRYAELSDDGVPLQPVGVPEGEAVRDYE